MNILSEEMDNFGILSEEPSFETLKKYRKKLTDDERAKVMKAKAVWHHGPNGEATSAIWKSEVKGKTYYATNTHRSGGIATTLEGAISKYHDYVKDSA